MRNFSEDTNKYLSEVFTILSKLIDKFDSYEDFSKFNDNRFMLHNHILFTMLGITADGISDAIQFVGSDHKDLVKSISDINDKKESAENIDDGTFSKLDRLYNGFMNSEDLTAIMSYKSRYDKHCNIPVYIRQENTRNQLIQKFIGFYAEDYMRLHFHAYKIDDVKTYDDEYWYAFFHWIGFKAIFNKVYNLDIDTRVEYIDSSINGELVVFNNNQDIKNEIVSVKIPFVF